VSTNVIENIKMAESARKISIQSRIIFCWNSTLQAQQNYLICSSKPFLITHLQLCSDDELKM
jgi:hypothetical protein